MVYERSENLFIFTLSAVSDAYWIGDGPVYKLTKTNSVEIGLTVRKCLEASRYGMPHPTDADRTKRIQPLLEAAGVKSYSDFAKLARSVRVMIKENGMVTLLALRNEGRGRFLAKAEEQGITLGTDRELGEAVLMALSSTD